MKTVVYQSFRTKDVPVWINACLDSVKQWAALHGFDYRFYGDEFFEFVPARLRTRASTYNCLLADYARLVAARALLNSGYARAIWLDADALVFAPHDFRIPVEHEYAFSREIWLDRIVLGQPQFKLQVNNALSVFCQGQALIDFYLANADRVLLGDTPLAPATIGTEFLTQLRRAAQFPLVTHCGIFGPEMARRYLRNDGRFLSAYLALQTSAVFAVNLCLSHQDRAAASTHRHARPISPLELIQVVEKLQSDAGRSLNTWFHPTYHPPRDEFERPISRYIGLRHACRSLLNALHSN